MRTMKLKMSGTMKTKADLKNSILIFIPIVFFCFSCSSMPVDKGLLSCDVETYYKPLPANEDLFYAVKAGDLKTVKQILNKRVNINVADRLGQSAIMWAGWNGHYEVLEYLLNFDAEQRKKSYYPLNYKTESKEQYNPLFCLIMSNSMQTSNTLKAMELLINNEKKLTGTYQLLEKEDAFNENILHKAVRSSYPEYLTFFIEMLKQIDPNKTLLHKLMEKKNTSSETPLVLAVKLQNKEMVKILIDNGADILQRDNLDRSLSVLALNNGRGNYYVYLTVMKAKLRYALEEEKSISEKNIIEKERKYPRTDDDLDRALKACTVSVSFWTTYNRFKDTKVIKEEQLEDSGYKDTIKRFFDLIFQADSGKSLDVIKTMIKENPYVMQVHDKEGSTGKSALQISIESGNEDLFTTLFEYTNRNQIPIIREYGDYLICAILNKQLRIIEKLLEYNKNSRLPEKIMSPHNHFNSALSMTPHKPTGLPLVQFLRTDELRTNAELLDSMLIYYQPAYANNSNYAGQVYSEALRYNDERLMELLYECSNEGEGFYKIKTVSGSDNPVHFILLEKNFFKALNMFLRNSTFNYNHKCKDKNNKEYTFQELLDERKNEPEVEKIIEYLKSVKLYKEKTTQ